MLKRNKRIISIIALAAFTFIELPVQNVTAFALETATKGISTNQANENGSLALEYFSKKYKENNKLELPTLQNSQSVKTSSLKKITLNILNTEVKLSNGDASTAKKYIDDLITELEKSTSLLSNFHISKEISSDLSLNTSPKAETVPESVDVENEVLEESKSEMSVNQSNEIAKVTSNTAIGNTLEFYFYHNDTLQQHEVDNIINDAYNALMSKYTTTFNTSMLKVVEANSSDFIESPLSKDLLDIVGKNNKDEYYNINSKIPGVDSIPEKLNIKPYAVIDSTVLSSLSDVQGIIVEFDGEKYLLNNVDYAKSYLLSNMDLYKSSSIKINVIVKDNNNLFNYSLSKNIETTAKESEFKFDITNYQSSIDSNNKVNYNYFINCPTNLEGSNVYTIANIPSMLPIKIESTGKSNISLQTDLNNYVHSLDMYYMDSNGYYYNKVYDDFIDLSRKSIQYKENLEFNFVGLNSNKSYRISKINNQDISSTIVIKDNKASLSSLSDNYFIPSGKNTITVTDGTDEIILPFSYSISGLQYKILYDAFPNNKITINNKTKEIDFIVAVSDEFSEDELELKYSNTGDKANIETTKIGPNIFSVKLKNLDKLPEVYNDTISIIVNNKVTYIPIYKDALMPTIKLVNNGSIYVNNGIYHFNGSSLKFEISDNDQVKKLQIQKNNDIPVDIICNVKSSDDYSYSNNQLTINNIPNDVKTSYKIIIEDINGNITTPQTFEVINDTKTPIINYAKSPTNQYSYTVADGVKNIYIMADKVENNLFKFYFSISEDINFDPSIIDSTSLTLSYNGNIYTFKENEIQYDYNKKLYYVPLQLPSQNKDMEIIINAKDFANNKAKEYKLGVIYSNDAIVDENIVFKFEGIDAKNNDTLKTTSIMNSNNFDLYISKALKNNNLILDSNNSALNAFKSLNKVTFKLNDSNPITFKKQGNEFNIPVQTLKLNHGENILEFELNCTNGREYKGKINIYYDPVAPTIELIDTAGNNVISNNYTDINESSYTGLKNPIKEIRIIDGNKKEIDNLSVEFMGKNLNINDFKVDTINSSNLTYTVKDFSEEKYSLNYSISSIFDKDTNPNTGFNSKDRSIRTDSPLKYKYDVSKPTIDSNVLTQKYKDTKVYNNNASISIGSFGKDIAISDNLNDVLDIEYRISDRDGTLYVENSIKDVYSYNIPLLGATGTSLPNGQYVIQLKVTDSVGNSSSIDNNYFTRVFIVDDKKPLIDISHSGLIDNDRMNTNFNASVFVSDYDLDYVTIQVDKYTTLNDNNPKTVYSTTFNDEITQDGPVFTATIDNKIEEILNLSSGIYRVKVISNDRSSNGDTPIIESSNFIFYDNEKPEIDLGKFTDSYLTSKIYNSSNNSITIGQSPDNDIIVTDNMSETLKIEYFIYDEEGVTQLKSGNYQGSIGLNSLGNGRYKIKVKVTDETENEIFSSLGNFVIDNVAPTFKINGLTYNSSDLELLNRPLNLSVEVNDISISYINVRVQLPNNTFVEKICNVSEAKNFIATFDQFSENGDYTLYIDASDRAGNILNTVTRKFRIDTTAPIINGAQVNGNRVNPDIMNYTNSHNSSIFVNFSDNLDVNGDIELILTASKNNVVKSLKNGDSLKEDGEYVIKAQVKDKAGNMSTVYSFNLTVDTVLPVIDVSGVNTGHYYNKDVTPSWTVDDEKATLSVTLNGNPFDSSILSNEGNYTLTLKATDLAGNVATNIVTFVIDKTAPKITVENVENLGYYTNPITPAIKWDDKDAIATILLQNVNYYGQEIDKDGSYVLYVKVVDKAGNISDASYKFRLNVSKPEINIDGVSDGDVVVGGFTPNFKFKDTVEYQILLNGKAYHGEEITEDGNYTFVITAKDEDGVETVKTVNFKVENTSKETISGNVTTDKKDSSNLPLAVGSGVGLVLISILGYFLFKKNK